MLNKKKFTLHQCHAQRAVGINARVELYVAGVLFYNS